MDEQWKKLDIKKTLDVFFKILGSADNCEYKYKIMPKAKMSLTAINDTNKIQRNTTK